MILMSRVVFLFACVIVNGLIKANPTVYFYEDFPTEDSLKKWVESTYKGNDQGKFIYTAGKYFSDINNDKGIKTSENSKFYGISYKLNEPFSNRNKILVVQFQVKHEQMIDCGGGYIKLLGKNVDQKNFHGETPYEIMFGPDICGMGTKKVHVILSYKGENHLTKKDIACKDDEFSHLYTLILRPDNTYEVLIDNEKVEGGNLEDDWAFLPPKRINDPSAQKPSDWVDEPKMPDPTDVKPNDWDVPKTIPDPKATKPQDWDDEMDGEWEPPQIDNPSFKGEWKQKEIDNPNYKGPWMHPEIDNPNYKSDDELYVRNDIETIGFDLWQVKAGTIFDNILITDDPQYASEMAIKTWKVTFEGEKKMKEVLDEEKRRREEAEEAKKKATEKAQYDENEVQPDVEAKEKSERTEL